MEKQWNTARALVFQQIRRDRAANAGASRQKIVDLIIDSACEAGVDMRHESSLERMKSLLVDALRAAGGKRKSSDESPHDALRETAEGLARA